MGITIKQTKIGLRSDRATGLSYVGSGANINGLAFNLDYITEKDGVLAKTLMNLYDRASNLEELPWN